MPFLKKQNEILKANSKASGITLSTRKEKSEEIMFKEVFAWILDDVKRDKFNHYELQKMRWPEKLENRHIYWWNFYDYDKFPSFKYSEINVLSDKVETVLAGQKTLQFFHNCNCKTVDCLNDAKYCCQNKNPKFGDIETDIIECFDCNCSESCPNRVVQHGGRIPLLILKSRDKGWTVRTLVDIDKNQFVVEYTGEIILVQEDKNEHIDGTYQFEIGQVNNGRKWPKGRAPKAKFLIDALFVGNCSRFVSHSCKPNLEAKKVLIERKASYRHIAFYAIREIKAGEELTIDYFPRGAPHFTCHCHSVNCRNPDLALSFANIDLNGQLNIIDEDKINAKLDCITDNFKDECRKLFSNTMELLREKHLAENILLEEKIQQLQKDKTRLEKENKKLKEFKKGQMGAKKNG